MYQVSGIDQVTSFRLGSTHYQRYLLSKVLSMVLHEVGTARAMSSAARSTSYPGVQDSMRESV